MIKVMEENGGAHPRRTDSSWQTNKKVDEYKVDGSKVTWHPHGLSSPQETSNVNVLGLTINPNQQNLFMERIPQNTYIYEDFPYKEKFLLTKKPKLVLHYYKNPKPSEINVRIIYPNSGTLEL